jgi:hypothetical protein
MFRVYQVKTKKFQLEAESMCKKILIVRGSHVNGKIFINT